MAASPSVTAGEAATQIAPGNDLALASTVAAGASGALSFVPPSSTKITVLPRVEGEGAGVRFELEQRTRYEPVKLLGAGGMGEVVLVQDQDIARRVAIKRLLPEMTHPSLLARFVDEIRTVGRLEHPNIVPIHDVGVDELGRYYFVMKYVEGETLESIIDKLAAGDPGYRATYSYERRIEIFIGVLHALEYAHDSGVVHRDVKPANVMVGRYGEVVLMDWGISKPLSQARDPAAAAEASLASRGEGDGKRRMFATQLGSIVGTPAYMSPEQARGENDRLDARCDLYSATVLFQELVSLRHYLHGTETMEAMLAKIREGKDPGFLDVLANRHPHHGPVPGELAHFITKGLAKDPANRFQSAAEMIQVLERVLDGRVAVQCHATFTKRAAREFGRFVDARPHLAFFLLVGTALTLVTALALGAVWLVRSVI